MKKTIVFGSFVAIFLMLMIPNISALEYQTVKGLYEEKNESVQSILDFLSNKIYLSKLKTNFFIILTEILQGFFISGMYIFSLTVLGSIENSFIGIIIYLILMNLASFILSRWDESIENNFELTKIQEIISMFGAYVVYYIITTFYGYLITNDNYIKKHIN